MEGLEHLAELFNLANIDIKKIYLLRVNLKDTLYQYATSYKSGCMNKLMLLITMYIYYLMPLSSRLLIQALQ